MDVVSPSTFSKPRAGASPRKGSLQTAMRPSESVREYLLAGFGGADMKHGTRLPTVRELALRLKVSSYTVQRVFTQLAREGRIRTEVGNGTFLMAKQQASSSVTRIALGFWEPKNPAVETWAYRVCGGMMSAAMRLEKPIAFLPLPRQEGATSDVMIRKLLDERGQASGLIQFPYAASSEEIRLAYEDHGKPVVNLNPPSEQATRNFVSPDYYGASYRLGRVWRQTRRRRVLLMLDWPAEYSVSSRLRLAGLTNGLAMSLDDSITCQVVSAVDVHRYEDTANDGYVAMCKILDRNKWLPDAVYCHGDLLAIGAVRALREKGLDVPTDVSVVGGSGFVNDPACPGLTSVCQSMETIGEKLVQMLVDRIASSSEKPMDLPGEFVAMPFAGGATTRAEENELLEIGGANCKT